MAIGLLKFYNRITNKLSNNRYIGQVPVRFVLGWVFLWAGWGKLNNLENVVGYFVSLGIPMASIQAPFIAVLEFVGGICIILGLGTRVFSFLLASTMVVALLTAIIPELETFTKVFSKSETIYLSAFIWLTFSGGGNLSIDTFLKEKIS